MRELEEKVSREQEVMRGKLAERCKMASLGEGGPQLPTPKFGLSDEEQMLLWSLNSILR